MPTDWESRYKDADTPWDKGAPSPGLEDYLQSHPVHGKVLVPGCGFGHDVRLLAAQAPAGSAQVVGIDIAPSAIAGADSRPKAGGERYELADLFNLPANLRGAFDWVWEHTCFCAVDPDQRPAYVEAVAGALRPGGQLLAVFYLDPGPGDGPPFGVGIRELDALFGSYFQLKAEWMPSRAYPGREGREWMRILTLL